MEKGLIIRKEADQFLVELENEKNLICKARKILKKEGVFVGDKIFLDVFLDYLIYEVWSSILIDFPPHILHNPVDIKSDNITATSHNSSKT